MANAPVFTAEADLYSDDDRSSSLSDLDEGVETGTIPETVNKIMAVADGDSEAETERLEVSPNKPVKQENILVNSLPMGQKLDGYPNGRSGAEDVEAERFSDSVVSSPRSSDEESLSEGISDHNAELEEMTFDEPEAPQVSAGIKRKRTSEDNRSDTDEDGEKRARRKRTGSIRSDLEPEPSASEDEGSSVANLSREGSQDVMDMADDHEDELVVGANEDERLTETNEAVELLASAKRGRQSSSHMRVSQHEDSEEPVISQAEEEQVEVAEGSDEEELAENDDIEDAEAAVRSEEEREPIDTSDVMPGIDKDTDAKRTAAMDALLALEKRFATLRDRLYDERIASINHELAQLSGPHPTHPELLRQVQVVQQHRDEKFDIEQKLLVFKIGALKRKSIAERAQIHSAYFQTVRDVREKHLERASEYFYRIQRDRFKTDESVPSFSIPFPTRRSQQITQQTAYNKEVSILSGVAKYIGFPAAPDLANASSGELDEDLEKMGITANPLRTSRPVHSSHPRPGPSVALSQPAAEEQFLEQTPWANPQHPIHHQYLNRLKRPTSVQSRMQEPVATPAGQKSQVDVNAVTGSASTIAEQPSAQASSTMNTPYDTDANKPQVQASSQDTRTVNSADDPQSIDKDEHAIRRSDSASPTETRKAFSATFLNSRHSNRKHGNDSQEALSQASRVTLFNSPTRPNMPRAEYEPRRQTASPITFNKHARENGITARTGLGGIGAR